MYDYSPNYFMAKALEMAEQAFQQGEVPVGCVVVQDNRIVTKNHNLTEQQNDPTAHAEIISLASACHQLGNKILSQASVYLTLEPCVMCAGAIYWARPKEIIIAASDPNKGYRKYGIELHPKTKVQFGLQEKRASELMTNFFAKKR